MSWLVAALLAGQDAVDGAEAAAAAEPALRAGWLFAAATVTAVWWWKRGRLPRGASATLLVVAAGLALLALPTPAQAAIDSALDATWSRIGHWATEPLLWALLLGGTGLLMMLPRGDRRRRVQGAVAGLVSLGFFAAALPALAGAVEQAVFWALAAVTLVSAVATVTMRSAVYSAIWFALSLLGTAGLFFYQGSQFLGVATIVVYAGAIVVTFLFVIMLAQPEGHAVYDRLTWGSQPKLLSVLAAALLVAALAYAVSSEGIVRRQVMEAAVVLADDEGPLLDDHLVAGVARQGELTVVTLRAELSEERARVVERELAAAIQTDVALIPLDTRRDVLHPSHMAMLGSEMFGRHLLSVELAGTLLLAALVGAIAMAIQGKDLDPAEEQA